MKKLYLIFLTAMLALSLAACKQSTIKAEVNATDPEGNAYVATTAETTKFEPITHEYVIPEGATGPGDVTLYGDEYDNYPEDKKPQKDTEPVCQVRYFYIGAEGLKEDFDVIEGKTDCTAEELIELLVNDGTLKDGTEFISYEGDENSGTVEISMLKGAYVKATKEQLAQAIANTLCDNLYLDEVTVIADGETYGPLEYDY